MLAVVSSPEKQKAPSRSERGRSCFVLSGSVIDLALGLEDRVQTLGRLGLAELLECTRFELSDTLP